jgi:glycosyltransferase involved in cell wall biosynthesis
MFASEGHDSFIATQSPSVDSPESVAQPNCRVFYLSGNLLEARKWEFLSLSEDIRASAAESMFNESDVTTDVRVLTGQLSTLVRDLNPDVIHAHSTYVVFNRVLEELRRQGMLSKIPVLATIHGLPKTLVLPSGQTTTDYEQLAESCPFDTITAVSKCVAAELHEQLPMGLRDLVRVLYLGVDLSAFRPEIHANKLWDLAFFGRIERVKAVDLLPDLLSALRPRFPEMRLAITGEGSYRGTLFDEFKRRDVTDLVDYLGVVPIETIPNLLNSARIFLYPSRQEALGLSLIEAMACGVPVITTNVFGPSEVVSHGHDGLAVKPGNLIELSNAVRRLLTDQRLQTRLGQNARKMVEERFDLKIHSEELLRIYRSSRDDK